MTLVVDASVAAKWFVEEEEGSAEAARLLRRGEGLVAPDLVVPEVCNVAWRKLRAGEMTTGQARAAVEGVAQLFDDLVPAARLAPRSFAIARELDHPVYDCFYLALAETQDARFVTADRRLIARFAETPWARRLASLYDGDGDV